MMKINALLMGSKDNVVTCTVDVARGETVAYYDGEKICCLLAEEQIPYCHKIALTDIKKGNFVLKYNEPLGKVTRDISKGSWVSDCNLCGISRDYDSEMV